MNHAFVDGNKRVGLQATEIFLNMNGYELRFSEATAEAISLRIASGQMSREDLISYMKTNICLQVDDPDETEPCAIPLVWEEL